MPPPELFPLPELTEALPAVTPQTNGQVTGFINPDMTGYHHSAYHSKT
jgi:hypothetical protein